MKWQFLEMSRHAAFMRLDFALSLKDEGDLDGAIEAACAALEILPDEAQFHFVLGELFELQGENGKASEAFQQALELQEEDHLGARVRLSVLGAVAPLRRLPAPYVAALFDDFAPRFEKSLRDHLSYRTPEQVYDMVGPHLKKQAHILDLGCGTGLSGLVFKDHADYLEGVDLSENMLRHAKDKKVYDTLLCADIETTQAPGSKSFDLVIACDALNYLGDLRPIMKQVSRWLKKEGLFAFSLESADEAFSEEYRLHQGLRYAHAPSAVLSWLDLCGFDLLEERFETLRHEKKQPVSGHLICAALRK